MKSIVRECLIEILRDGLGSSLSESKRVVDRERVEKEKVFEREESKRRQDTLVEIARKTAGSDSVLADVLADTARTTYAKNSQNFFTGAEADDVSVLQQQRPTHGMTVIDQVVAENEPADLFGDNAVERWSSLVFGEK